MLEVKNSSPFVGNRDGARTGRANGPPGKKLTNKLRY